VILIPTQEIACLRTKMWDVLVPFKLFSLMCYKMQTFVESIALESIVYLCHT